MQVDTGADSTVISSLIWIELGKPQLIGKARRWSMTVISWRFWDHWHVMLSGREASMGNNNN